MGPALPIHQVDTTKPQQHSPHGDNINQPMLIQQEDDNTQEHSSQEDNTEEAGGTNQQGSCFFGKKECFSWNKNPIIPSVGKTAPRNIIKVRCSSFEGPA